jgi:hypothetical protein
MMQENNSNKIVIILHSIYTVASNRIHILLKCESFPSKQHSSGLSLTYVVCQHVRSFKNCLAVLSCHSVGLIILSVRTPPYLTSFPMVFVHYKL